MADEVDDWIPSLSAARSAETSIPVRLLWKRRGVNLLERDPIATERLAAVLLVAHREHDPARPVFRYPYVPTMPFALEEGAVRVLERFDGAPPECLRVSLARRRAGGPYRGMPPSDPTFHGFDYADALPQVRRRIQALSADGPSPLVVDTYAWPILRLTFRTLFRRQEIAMLVRPDGVLHAMLSRGTLF